MSKLRKIPPCKQIVANTFNEDSNLITLPGDVLDNAIDAIRYGDSAAKAATFLIGQLKDVKYNIEQENLDPRGVYRGYTQGGKAIKHLEYLNSEFKLSKEIKRSLKFAINCTGNFFKLNKPELDKFKKEAEKYVSPEEKREVNKGKDLLLSIACELKSYERKSTLEELLISVWIRVLPLIQEYKEQIGNRAFEKTIFGSKGKLCFKFIAKFPNSIDYKNLERLLDTLPIYLLAKLFRGFSLEINEDLTVKVFCQGREEHYRQHDQREYRHPSYGGNPHFTDEQNNWFKENKNELNTPIFRANLGKELEEILSQYSDEVLFPPKKTDEFVLSLKSDEIKEL